MHLLSQPKRILALVTDGFGGQGGIARFNRDLLSALCAGPDAHDVIAVPRLMQDRAAPLPDNLQWDTSGLDGKGSYLRAVLRHALGRARPGLPPHKAKPETERPRRWKPDLLLCGHLHLLPAAFMARRVWALGDAMRNPEELELNGLRDTPIALVTHGIEAWEPSGRTLTDRLARRVDSVIAVSRVTLERFSAWSGVAPQRGVVLPNCVDLQRFNPGPKSAELLDRYALHGRTVLMTLGRLKSEQRRKGFDEVLDLLPELAGQVPELAYVIAGDGPDRDRLVAKARGIGCQVWTESQRQKLNPDTTGTGKPLVVFTGFVTEAEKPAHYRLADVFLMPSRGEGFGIVLLEAMACGIPVVASRADGSREAVLDGALGRVVDPGNRWELRRAILESLSDKTPPAWRRRPRGIEYFSSEHFLERVTEAVQAALTPARGL